MPFPRDDSALRDAVARVVTLISVCCDLATKREGGGFVDLLALFEVLHHPLVGLSADQLSALDGASERQLVTAFWKEVTERGASGHFEYGLARLEQPAQAARLH